MADQDELVRALLDPPRVRVVAALTTETVREAARRHGTVGAATVALGRTMTAGVLLATLTKGDERVTLQIAGDGPITQITADSNDAGQVRGYVSPHGVAAPLGTQPRPQVGAAVGRGQVMVVRDLGLKEQYRGSAAIVTGEIDEDVEAYLRQSEQLDSALGCEVVVGEHGAVQHAGGVLVQAMPEGGGAPTTFARRGGGVQPPGRSTGEPELIRAVQHALRTGALYHALAGPTPPADGEAMARAVLEDLALDFIDRRPVRFVCRCSPERARLMLGLLDLDEIDEMMAEGRAEITCNFCQERYLIDGSALAELRAEVAMRGPREKN
jgi:molecular chaperone Hsp33